ncbi:MAG: ATP-binding protein [Phycisphaerales bacterium]
MSAPKTHDAISLTNDPQQVRAAREDFAGAIEHFGFPREAAFAVMLAFDEAVANGLKYGAAQQPGGAIDLSWSVQKDRVRIVVDDHGPGFDPDNIPDCTLPENIEKACGRGVMLMRAYMTSVEFNDKGNKVTLVYERN